MATSLRVSDKDTLVDLIGGQAILAETPQRYFSDLIREADLPPEFVGETSGRWHGDAFANARWLLDWAAAKEINPQDWRYTTLGSVLTPLLKRLGLQARRDVAAVIIARGLYVDAGLQEALRGRFLVPFGGDALAGPDPLASAAPVYSQPADDLELQRLLRADPDLLDVGFLRLAIERAASVCRVERPDGTAIGTGVLIGEGRVLTNCHVVEALGADGDRDLGKLAANARLRFGAFTATSDRDHDSFVVSPSEGDALVAFSPTTELDFTLIAIDRGATMAHQISPAPLETAAAPAKGAGVSLLQHPRGETMKLAITANGITAIDNERGTLQYVSRTAGGSSGAPCFSDDWKMIALHHAERARPFGAIREGILLSEIHKRIARDL
jgi:V8-like Glu-specific endopeptidase